MALPIKPLRVRRSAFIQATRARVWREFVDFDALNRWFGRGHQLEAYTAKVGTELQLSVEVEGERRSYGGTVLVLEPEQELSFECNWHPPHAWPVPTFITLRLSSLCEGTQVEIYHHGFEAFGEAAAATLQDYESRWTNHHLVALRALVEETN